MRPTRLLPMRALLRVLVAAALLACVLPARADADPPRFDSGAGFPTVGNFPNVTLNGTSQLTSTTMSPFVIVDDSGALLGWNVSFVVPDFHNGTGADCTTGSTASVSAASLTMGAPVVAPADGVSSMTGITANGYTDFTTARKIVDAAVGDGAGSYTVSPQSLQLTVPTDIAVGAYCTQATVSIAVGP